MSKRFLASAPVAICASAAFAAAVYWFLVDVEQSPVDSGWYNAPIAAPFLAIFLDRLFPRPERPRTVLAIDVLVIALALMRVVVPPLPFISGHALFAGYATLSARRWPLRGLAFAVLVHVVWVKLYVTGGVWSMLGGLAAAGLAFGARRRASVHESSLAPC